MWRVWNGVRGRKVGLDRLIGLDLTGWDGWMVNLYHELHCCFDFFLPLFSHLLLPAHSEALKELGDPLAVRLHGVSSRAHFPLENPMIKA